MECIERNGENKLGKEFNECNSANDLEMMGK